MNDTECFALWTNLCPNKQETVVHFTETDGVNWSVPSCIPCAIIARTIITNNNNKENTVMNENTVIIPLLDSDICLGKNCKAPAKSSPAVYWKGSNVHFILPPALENIVADGGKPWTRVLMPLCGNHMRWLTSKKGINVDYERVAAAMPFTGHCDCGACTTMGEAKACFEELAARVENEINNKKEINMITTDINNPVVLTMDAAKKVLMANREGHRAVRWLNGWIVSPSTLKVPSIKKEDKPRFVPAKLTDKVFPTRIEAVQYQITQRCGKVVAVEGGFKVVPVRTATI